MNEREKVFEVKLVIAAPEFECDNEPTEEEIEELIIDDLAHYAEAAANGFNVLAKDFMHDYETACVISGISRMYITKRPEQGLFLSIRILHIFPNREKREILHK